MLARPLHEARSAGPELADQGAAPFARRNLAWLEDTLNRGRALAGESRPFGIFGTSIAGIWIHSAIGSNVDFFVDEDDMRVGRKYFGVPILAPASVPAGATVFVCLEPELSQAIAARHADSTRRYVTSPMLR